MFKTIRSRNKRCFKHRCTNTLRLLLSFTLSVFTVATMASEGSPHWSYGGSEGPQNWGSLAQEYGLCSRGTNQSPININGTVSSNLFQLSFNYGTVPLQIHNNGHTIQINYTTISDNDASTIVIEGKKHLLPSATSYNSSISISGEEYNLLQVHFHSPSEHHVAGSPYSMEAHFVHGNGSGQLAVVGVLLKEGKSNEFLSQLWSNMPGNVDGVHTVNGVQLNATDLLPNNKSYYHYRGSLTTPPCSEAVRWFVMRNPAEVSSSQISKFLSVIGENARPVQKINSRYLLRSQ